MIEFKLPSLGADMDEGRLLEWKIKPGDKVTRGQVIAVVDTSKAAVEVESWHDGVVHQLLTKLDETIPVGSVMALLLEPGETAPAVAGTPGAAAATQGATAAAPVIAAPPVAAVAAPAVTAPPPAPTRAKISPAARKRADELGVRIEDLGAGTGPDGAIVIADVERAAQRRAPAPPAPTDRAAEMRRTIAAAMARSKREIPHYYLAETIPLGAATNWLAEANARRPMAQRLLMAVPLLKAVAMTLPKFPELNGYYRDGAFQPADAVHIGVAIALRHGGLIAPALHDVAALAPDDLMARLGDLIQRTRAGSLRSSELSDATVTVTSLGEQGVDVVHGVIYPPQVALIGFGRVAERAVAANGAVVAMPAVTASLAADHRVSDGHRGALFLAALRDLLQHPERLTEAP